MPFLFGSFLDRSGLQSTNGRSAGGAEPESPWDRCPGEAGRQQDRSQAGTMQN